MRRPELLILKVWYSDDITQVGISLAALDHAVAVEDRGGERCYLRDDVLKAWREMALEAADE